MVFIDIAHLDKQISHLRKRSGVSNQVRIPVRRLEKFSKLEEDTLKYGQDMPNMENHSQC